MLHHYIHDDKRGEHYAVGASSSTGRVLVQVQEGSEQARIAVSPEQARHMAQLLLAKADELSPRRRDAV